MKRVVFKFKGGDGMNTAWKIIHFRSKGVRYELV
jgi:hypothetical protein